MRRLLTLLGLAAGIAILATTGGWIYWLISAQAASAAVDNWVEAMLKSGYDINIDRQRFDGFPRSVDVVLDGFEMSGKDHYVPWTWTISRVRVSHALLGNRAIRIRPSGIQTIVYTLDDERRIIRLGAARWSTVVETDPEGGAALIVDLAGFVWAPEGQKPVTIGQIRADVLLPVGDAAIPRGTQVTLRIEDIELPEEERALGNTVEAFEATAEFITPVPAGNPWQALEAWTGIRGRVWVSDGLLKWGALEADGMSGRIAVDERLRPEAELKMQFHGYADLAEAFFEAGKISATRRRDILLVLEQAANENRTVFEYPLTLRGGSVLINGMFLGNVRQIIPWKPR